MPSTSHITTSGGLISTAFVENIRQAQSRQRGTQAGTFALGWAEAPASPAGLEARIAETWEALLERWDAIATDLPHLDLSQARERWILPLLRTLEFRPVYRRTDIVLDESEALRFNVSHFGWEAADGGSGLENRDWGEERTPNHAPPPIHTVSPAAGLDARPAGAGGRSPKSKSPHDMLQLFLNLNRDYRWAILTNGLYLRLLRDYHHTYTKGYVEFDLESLFESRNFADFRALYRMAHASRFTAGLDPAGRWQAVPLEMFYRDSQAAGIQGGANLQKQVREAIETLGNGLLLGSGPLLVQLQADPVLCRRFYAELLQIIYRLLFLLYAEQRGIVPQAGASLESLYRQGYSLTALRARAERDPASPEAYDLWEGLKVTFKMFQQGAGELGIYRYDGMLFAGDQTPLLDGIGEPPATNSQPLKCRNYELLQAIRALTLVEAEGVLQRISYADLDVEEIGGIYESLLDFAPQVSTGAEEVEGREIPPNTFFLDPRGTARKTTGSYYTHPSLVNALIESALIPVLEQRLAAYPQAPEDAILSLKVCDPAMGSGHFLIAANNALALRLAQVRTGDEYPAEDELRQARRDVLGRCIYGVDLNPMAVELCKVSLWINAAVNDAPLSFLDHHLKVGNSLIGATPELMADGIPYDAFALGRTGDDRETAKILRARNRRERRDVERGGGHQPSLFQVTALLETEEELRRWVEVNRLAPEQPQQAREQYARYRASDQVQGQKLLADFWTAAFFWPMPDPDKCDHDRCGLHGDQGELLAPTYGEFTRLKKDEGPEALPPDMLARVERLAAEYDFFHWHIEFPDVFVEEGDGGFDVVLGNPPWERIKLQEKEFFADKDPAIANASNAAARRRLIRKLPQEDPALWRAYRAALRRSEAESDFLRNSGLYPLTGRGDVNTYQVFAELARDLPADRGRAGVIVPTGIATDYTNRDFFADLVESGQLASLYDFENRHGIFPEVHRSYKFSLLTLRGPAKDAPPAEFAFFLLDATDLADPERTFTLSPADFTRLNPNTKTCPIFRSRTDAELTRKLYAVAPVLVNEETGENPWGVSFLRMFDMTNDSHLFRTREELERQGLVLKGNWFVGDEEVYLPLCEAKMFWHFDHRFGTYEEVDSRSNVHLPNTTLTQYTDPSFLVHPWYWVNQKNVVERLLSTPPWLLVFRDITNTTNERTGIFTLLSWTGLSNKAPSILLNRLYHHKAVALVANLNAFVFDFVVRQKMGGTSLNFYIVEQLPILPPDRYTPELLAYIVPRVLELTYTAWDLRAFADDVWQEAGVRDSGTGISDKTEPEPQPSNPSPLTPLQQAILRQWQANRDATQGGHAGAVPPQWATNPEQPTPNPYPHPPFKWDEARRAQLRADLDGLYGHLYGVSREELAYILDTFPIVRRKDEEKYGEYRTKRLVLEAYDRQVGNWPRPGERIAGCGHESGKSSTAWPGT